MSLLLYLAVLILLLVTLPEEILDPESQRFIFVFGAIALWRYGWIFIYHADRQLGSCLDQMPSQATPHYSCSNNYNIEPLCHLGLPENNVEGSCAGNNNSAP